MTSKNLQFHPKFILRGNTREMKESTTLDVSQICVVIPAFKVRNQILQVVNSIGPEVQKIIVVDDACPEKSGHYLEENVKDPRVQVIFHEINLGVGGAVKSGYKRALELNSDFVVKIDGDGQMDPAKIEVLINPIKSGIADYSKGNRFFDVEAVRSMPKIRILGNLALSFMTKLSSGLWHIFDPNNGFTAISASTLVKLNLEKIDDRYFFESDMLFRLNLLDARVIDIPLPAIYASETSNLRIRRVLFEFPIKHLRNTFKRIGYTYYLRDFKIASIELPVGLLLFAFGLIYGAYSWIHGIVKSTATQTGTLVLIAMSVLAGLQLILAFFSYDTTNPKK
jgi:dolichol-phosphate mannosyltransferase